MPTSLDLPEVLAPLWRDRVLPILRYPDGGPVGDALRVLHATGVSVAEVTSDTPGAVDAIAAATADGMVAGMGTTISAGQVRDCAAAGGRFVVSPGLDPEVVRAALDAGLVPVPGVATATEVQAARRAGANVLKLFPCGALGVPYLNALRGPFRSVPFLPTGGIGMDDIGAFLRAGAVAVGLSSVLVGHGAPVTDEERDALRARTLQALEAARDAAVPAASPA